MVDVAFGPEPGRRPNLGDQTASLSATWSAASGCMAASCCSSSSLLMASGFRLAEERNAGDFLAGPAATSSTFPSEVLSEAWANRANLPGYVWQHLPVADRDAEHRGRLHPDRAR